MIEWQHVDSHGRLMQAQGMRGPGIRRSWRGNLMFWFFGIALLITPLLIFMWFYGGSDTTDWRLDAVPLAGDRQIMLSVYVPDSPCYSTESLNVKERSDVVEITPYLTNRTPDCQGRAMWDPQIVQLSAPVGERRLIGCAAGKYWVVDDPADVVDCRAFRASPDVAADDGQGSAAPTSP